MPAPRKYPDELRERAVRLYRESEPRPTFRRPDPWAWPGSRLPSNSRKIWLIGLPTMFASTLSHPRCGIPMTTSSSSCSAQFGISAVAAATAAGMFALACYAPLRSLPAAGLAGGVGWAVYGALALFAPFGVVVVTGVAATVVGVATGVARRGTGPGPPGRCRCPPRSPP